MVRRRRQHAFDPPPSGDLIHQSARGGWGLVATQGSRSSHRPSSPRTQGPWGRVPLPRPIPRDGTRPSPCPEGTFFDRPNRPWPQTSRSVSPSHTLRRMNLPSPSHAAAPLTARHAVDPRHVHEQTDKPVPRPRHVLKGRSTLGTDPPQRLSPQGAGFHRPPSGTPLSFSDPSASDRALPSGIEPPSSAAAQGPVRTVRLTLPPPRHFTP